MPLKSKTKANHIFTPEVEARWEQAVREEEAAHEPHMGKTRRYMAEWRATLAQVREVLDAMRQGRHSQGLTLDEVAQRARIATVEQLLEELDMEDNPRVTTLFNYARALKKRLVIRFEDDPDSE